MTYPRAETTGRRKFWISPGLVSLVQYLLMLVVIAVLLVLLFRRSSAEVFAAALIIGAIIAALPSMIFSGLLPWRASRRLERLRCEGVLACAEVLSLPELPTPSSTPQGTRNIPLLDSSVQVSVRLIPDQDIPTGETLMVISVEEIPRLSPGIQVIIRLDPARPDLVLFDSM